MDRWLHPLSRIIPSRRQGHGSGFGHEAWPVVVMVYVKPVLRSTRLPPSTSTDLACRRGVTHRSSRLTSLTRQCSSSATVDGTVDGGPSNALVSDNRPSSTELEQRHHTVTHPSRPSLFFCLRQRPRDVGLHGFYGSPRDVDYLRD